MKIANPKLTLYAFHLRNNLTQGEEKTVADANHLWEQCQEIGIKLNVPRLESLLKRLQDSHEKIGITPSQDNPESNYLELLPERQLKFSAIRNKNQNQRQLTGEVYPLQIHDTYAVDITLRYPEPNIEIKELADLKSYLHIAQSDSLLGQTLVLFAHPEEKINDVKAFANNCLNLLVPESDIKNDWFYAQGSFLGSPIVEYSNNQKKSSQPNHILIWLNCNNTTECLENNGAYYHSLIKLLCCRSKILYAYFESRWCNQQARRLYRQLDSKVKALQQLPSAPMTRLNSLKEWLTELSQTAFEYANHLRDLEIHRTTIEANRINYKLELTQLNDISIKDEDNLDFWQQFISKDSEKFIEQICTDLSYLLPSQQLFQQMIDTIRGIVETEQAESDRALQDTVAIVGVGLAAAAIGSTVAPYVIPTESQHPILPPFSTNHFHPLTQSLLLSLVFGVTGAVVTKGITALMQNRREIAGRLTHLIRGSSNKTAKLPGNTQQSLPQSQKQKK